MVRPKSTKLEELVSLDTMYFDSPDTPVCSDEICENDEIVRLAAYRQRLAERKLQYDKKYIDEKGTEQAQPAMSELSNFELHAIHSVKIRRCRSRPSKLTIQQ
jgi:hypothetical protein